MGPDIWKLYWWGVGIAAVAVAAVELTKGRVLKERNVRFYGPLPPRFFGPFSKGELAAYFIQCFMTPTTIFVVFGLARLTDRDQIVYLVGIPYLLAWIAVIPHYVERKIDKWGPS